MLLKAPNLPPGLEVWKGPANAIRDGWSVSRAAIEAPDLSGLIASGFAFDQVRLTSAILSAAELPRARLWDVEFQRCEAAGLALAEAEMHRVVFTACRLSGADLSPSQIEHVRFENCKLDHAIFRGSRLAFVQFVGCDLSASDFVGSSLSNVAFENCKLGGVDFERCAMKDVDLRTSDLAEIKSAAGLSGSTIDPTQALELATKLAAQLGVIVDR